MPTTTTGLITRPAVHRAPFEGAGRLRSSANPAPRGETDFLLHRSYALVERLRRAVADRTDDTLIGDF